MIRTDLTSLSKTINKNLINALPMTIRFLNSNKREPFIFQEKKQRNKYLLIKFLTNEKYHGISYNKKHCFIYRNKKQVEPWKIKNTTQ